MRVWAIDFSSAMSAYLKAKAASAELENVAIAVASAESLPLVDQSGDLVVSNYCFHHLDDAGKTAALRKRSGSYVRGALAFADMMFGLGVSDARNREIVRAKVRSMLAKGAPGLIRLVKNGCE